MKLRHLRQRHAVGLEEVLEHLLRLRVVPLPDRGLQMQRGPDPPHDGGGRGRILEPVLDRARCGVEIAE